MTRAGFVYDPLFLEHRPPAGHPESPHRLARVMQHLEGIGALDSMARIAAAPADRADLLAVHDATYLATLESLDDGYLDQDTYCSARSFEAALAAAGGVCAAIDACREGKVDRVFCAVRPPGHHAEAARGMGFCLLNNAAVGARHAQRVGYARVMVADFDVHHGNGTQAMFYDDDTVYYFSTHEYPHYPGTGASGERGRGKGTGFTRNIPLRSGAGDDELDRAWRLQFRDDAAAFRPDCCIVSAGYDLHAGDPLGDLGVTDAGVRGIVRSILAACPGVPVVFTLEGGYHPPTLARCVAITLEELSA